MEGGVWKGECGGGSVEGGVWRGECGRGSVEGGVWRGKCGRGRTWFKVIMGGRICGGIT